MHHLKPRCTVTIRYQGHKIVYSHARQAVAVDGQEYSAAGRPARLLVTADGVVRATE
jgi:hypothetical protein